MQPLNPGEDYPVLKSGTLSTGNARNFGGQCERWISKEFGDGRDARVKDSWRKRGKLVFEVLAARESPGTMDVYLCVVDKAADTMQKPSAFDQSWR